MTQELEVAGLDVVGGALATGGEHAAAHHGMRCANCSTPLQGAWCHACGQHEHDFHRSIWHLLIEFIEGLFHFDGRLWKTLPDLILRPARLTRRFVDGHRASQIPPLRMFLVLLLLLFFIGSALSDGVKTVSLEDSAEAAKSAASKTLTAEDRQSLEEAKAALDRAGRAVEQARAGQAAGKAPAGQGVGNPGAGSSKEAAEDEDDPEVAAALAGAAKAVGGLPPGTVRVVKEPKDPKAAKGFEEWMRAKANLVATHQEEFKLILEQWSERFAILMLPVGALLLELLFLRRRELYLFDHLIFTMHSMSFLCLLMIGQIIEGATLPESAPALMLLAPVHLFAHLKGFYRLSIWGASWRLALLLTGLSIGAALLLLGLFSVGVMELSHH